MHTTQSRNKSIILWPGSHVTNKSHQNGVPPWATEKERETPAKITRFHRPTLDSLFF